MRGLLLCFGRTSPGTRGGGAVRTWAWAFTGVLLLWVILEACSAAGRSASAESRESAGGHGELQFLRQDGSIAASITIEIADTPEARVKGLMGRWVLPERHGMLFIFEVPEIQRFWMHNTPLSLDMIFVDEHRRILNLAESTTPMSKQTYSSRGPAKYVVEVRAGFCRRAGIQEGMSIQWTVRSTNTRAMNYLRSPPP